MERNAARSSAWQALHLSLTFSSGRFATHHAAFSASAFCRVQLICGAAVAVLEAGPALHLSLTFSRLLVLKDRKAFISPDECILKLELQAPYLIYGVCDLEHRS